jgi:hypothetical protein
MSATTRTSDAPTSRPSARGVVALVVIPLLVLAWLVPFAVWQGEATLTAPLFCPDDKPDAFVVLDKQRITPGETAYDFSLYCMGRRGEVHEVGFFRPVAVLMVAHTVLVVALAGVLVVARRPRRAAADAAPRRDDAATASS